MGGVRARKMMGALRSCLHHTLHPWPRYPRRWCPDAGVPGPSGYPWRAAPRLVLRTPAGDAARPPAPPSGPPARLPAAAAAAPAPTRGRPPPCRWCRTDCHLETRGDAHGMQGTAGDHRGGGELGGWMDGAGRSQDQERPSRFYRVCRNHPSCLTFPATWVRWGCLEMRPRREEGFRKGGRKPPPPLPATVPSLAMRPWGKSLFFFFSHADSTNPRSSLGF